MRLYFDPSRGTLVTEIGEVVEGVQTISFRANTMGATNRVEVMFEALAVVPVPTKAAIDNAIDGLLRLQQQIVDNGQQSTCPHPDCDGTPMMCLVRETEALGLYDDRAADECPDDPHSAGLHYFRDDDICMYCGKRDMLAR